MNYGSKIQVNPTDGRKKSRFPMIEKIKKWWKDLPDFDKGYWIGGGVAMIGAAIGGGIAGAQCAKDANHKIDMATDLGYNVGVMEGQRQAYCDMATRRTMGTYMTDQQFMNFGKE